MTGIQFLAGVATFIFSTTPRQTLRIIQHPPSSYSSLWLHSAVPPFPQCYRAWSLMKHKAKFTFTSCKNRFHYITHLAVKYKKNVITNESIPPCEKEITTSFAWQFSCIKTFSPLDSTESKRHKLYQRDATRHQNDTFSRVLLAQGWIQFVHFVTTLCQQKAQSIIQLLVLV